MVLHNTTCLVQLSGLFIDKTARLGIAKLLVAECAEARRPCVQGHKLPIATAAAGQRFGSKVQFPRREQRFCLTAVVSVRTIVAVIRAIVITVAVVSAFLALVVGSAFRSLHQLIAELVLGGLVAALARGLVVVVVLVVTVILCELAIPPLLTTRGNSIFGVRKSV